MAKNGVSAISGITAPVVGEKQIYNIVSWYPSTPDSDKNPEKVTWELFKKRNSGKFTTTNIKKIGRSDFTFGESSAGETYKLQAYLYNAEGGGLIITPKPAKIPKINKVELFYVDDTKGNIFNFFEKLRAKANCVNMLGKELIFTLWEDDAKGAGHNSKNLAIATQKARVNANGLAAVDFTLTTLLMLKASKGEQDSKLEFYVTVEYFKSNKHATNNVDVNNPYPQTPTPQKPVEIKPVTLKPNTPPKAKDSPAASKPASKKEEKGIWDSFTESVSKKGGELWDWGESLGTAIKDKMPTFSVPEGKSPAVVKGEKAEKKEEKNKNDCCIIDAEYFVTNYEKEFPQKDKKGNAIPLSSVVKNSLTKVFKSISEYYGNEKKCCNKYRIAYMLATVKHETGHTFNPVEEANWLSWKVRKKYFEEMYDPILGKNEARKNKAIEIGNTSPGDGVKYYGRGYVQITGKTNYQKMKDKFNVNFVNDVTKVTEHEWAMKILIYGSEDGVFTGKKLSKYISDNKQDYTNARRVINGTDKAGTIAGYAEKIEKCLKIKECNCGDLAVKKEEANSTIPKKEYDVDNAVSKLNVNVATKSLSKCAKYVRIAIEAGGLSTEGRPISAKNYDKFLPKLGFTEINATNYIPVKGDIAVIQSIEGNPHGHICMYNGSNWVSDFKQRTLMPGPAYRKNPPRYNIYRWQ